MKRLPTRFKNLDPLQCEGKGQKRAEIAEIKSARIAPLIERKDTTTTEGKR